MISALVGAAFAIVACLLAWLRLRPVPPDTRAADAKAAMRESVADVKLAAAVAEVDEKAKRSEAISDVDRLNALADSSRGRRGPL